MTLSIPPRQLALLHNASTAHSTYLDDEFGNLRTTRLYHINRSDAKPRFRVKNTRLYEKDDPPMAYAYPPTRIP